MNCPNCGTPEKARVKVCPECQQAYASEDLLELRQLEYLIKEAKSWEVPDSTLASYESRLKLLEERLTRTDIEKAVPEQETVTEYDTPYVLIEKRIEVFGGPGTQYPALGFVSQGNKGKLIGISRNKQWWVIQVPTSYSPDGQGWIKATEVTAFHTQDLTTIQAPQAGVETAPQPEPVKPAPAPPAPPKEKVPFDQWLLSERNIKIALYSGGLLLLIAGIIFIGVNWTRIPGPGKFAITLLVTGLMFLGGYLLFQRPAYRIGGVALVGIACGFFVLNFAVLQIYVMRPMGLADTMMWLIASPFCLLLYILLAYWTKADLFTYLSMVALGSVTTAALVEVAAPELVYLLAFASLGLGFLVLAKILINTQAADFTCQPLTIVSHLLIPITFLIAFFVLVTSTGLTPLATGSIWLTIPILSFGTIFYVLNALWSKKELFAYITLVAFGITMASVLVITGVDAIISLLVYAVYALIMVFLARWVNLSEAAMFAYQPLMVVANILAPVAYLLAFFYVSTSSGNPWLGVVILGISTVFYLLVSFWSRRMPFIFAALASTAGLVFTVLYSLQVPLMVYPLVYGILALLILFLGYTRRFGELTQIPLLISSQGVMPIVLLLASLGWIFQDVLIEFPWLALGTLGVGVIFYISTDILYKRIEARWAAAVLFPVAFGMTLLEMNISYSSIGISFMVLAPIYLGLGYALQENENKAAAGWPLYATAYIMAGLITLLAIPYRTDLIRILFADVILLVLSAAIHRVYWWVYGAVWLFMLPVYFLIDQYVNALQYQGLIMGLLGLNYAAAGYLLGRRKLHLGGPFLSAAVFLSIVTIGLTWVDPLIATMVIAVSAVLYLLSALWLKWSWLLYPVLVLANLMVLTINLLVFDLQAPVARSLTLSYGLLGVILSFGAYALQQRGKDSWCWPLYIVGVVNIIIAYLASLTFVDWVSVTVATVFAFSLLMFSWLERDVIRRVMRFPILTYLGIGVLFIEFGYVLYLLGGIRVWELAWPADVAGLCGLFVLLTWFLRQGAVQEIYGIPLRWSGLSLIAIPLAGSIVMAINSITDDYRSIIVAITFGIAGLTYCSDAAVRKNLNQAYIGLGAFMVVIWSVLYASGISEPQAYIIPPGLALLGVGWFERTRRGSLTYKILTYSGLILLMGSAFIQSIPRGAYVYAILLGFESLVAVTWGVRSHCRCYVQVGGIALLANAIVQLGPGFVDLPRWIQIGLTGAILLGGGMAALFRREQILETRQKLTDEWRQWNP